MKTLEVKLRCDLGAAELLDRGQHLAESQREAARVEDAKRAAAKDYKEQLEEIYGRMREIGEAIRNKHEYRLVSCSVLLNSPQAGTKRVVRNDTGEFVRDEPMTLDEKQRPLFTPDTPDKESQAGAIG